MFTMPQSTHVEVISKELGNDVIWVLCSFEYSKVWNGYYTQREIDYLDEYYAQLEEGFVLDNQNIRDYARKAAKASLDADIKYNRMRQGKASVAEWEKAQAIFDNLSKSANFAACKRKPGDMAGLGS